MDILKSSFLILTLFIFSSCAKTSYIANQSIGQMKLLWNATENKELIKSGKLSLEQINSINQIEVYKDYFYKFWANKINDEKSNIYSKTTLLDRDAVTYLVIASPKEKVEALEECFWFVGCFPYLGFFSLEDAKAYAIKKKGEGNEIYLRKVLAYSTTGRFNDPILSTFFSYNEFELAETIFHELFHTIFFIKNEVDVNENLANFFGKKLTMQYFKEQGRALELSTFFQEEEKMRSLMEVIVSLGKVYAQNLEKFIAEEQNIEREKFKEAYISNEFLPAIKKECQKINLSEEKCWPLKITWNNASFAAFFTYEKGQDFFEKLYLNNDSDLKKMYSYIEERYKSYQSDQKGYEDFESYLFTK